MEAKTFESSAGDAAAYVLSRLPHPDAAESDRAAFVDAATGRTLSFAGLRRAALSLASALHLGLGLRRGDAVLLLLSPDDDPLLLPPILLGVLAAGCVAVAAHPDATAAEVAAAAHGSGATIMVAGPEMAKKVAGVVAAPLLLTSRSPDPRAVSAEELMDGGDPTALEALAEDRPGPWDAAIVVYSSGGKNVAMTHADLVAAVAAAGAESPDEDRVCLASLPTWGTGVHGGLPLLALGLPAAGVTTVLLPPSSDLRDVVAAHGATDVVATPDVAAALAAPMAPQGKLATLRRMTVVAQAPLAEDARQALRRRLPWVELTELSDTPETGTETAPEQAQVAPAELGALLLVQPEAASPVAIQHKGKIADQMSATNEATSLVAPLQKIQKTVFGDILSKSIAGKFLRKQPVVCDKQAISKL